MAAVADVVRAVNAAQPLDVLLDRIAEQACTLVAYRLSRAEKLLGRALRTTALRMELQLAFTVRDVQRAARPAG